MEKIYIIHEHEKWTAPLKKRLHELDLPYEDWFLNKGVLELSKEPPKGVFYSRMSASSHTRDHRFAPEYTAAVLSWLERNGRRVINGENALKLEISKAAQFNSLNLHGIRTPRTIAAIGKREIIQAADKFDKPFITKHNRAGKGLGVRLFNNQDALEDYVFSPSFEDSIDGVTLLQEYIQAPAPYITRCEFVGGEFLYAVKVDTSEGFELCPADVCELGTGPCPVTDAETAKFRIMKGFDHPILEKYREFLQANDILIAGIEFIVDEKGKIYTFDVNTNTNYNPDAEAKVKIYGMKRVAEYLGEELEKVKREEGKL